MAFVSKLKFVLCSERENCEKKSRLHQVLSLLHIINRILTTVITVFAETKVAEFQIRYDSNVQYSY